MMASPCVQMPSYLQRWYEVDDYDDPRRPNWTAAWSYFAPALEARGYSLFLSASVNPERPSATRHEADHLPAPTDPFRPKSGEAHVLAVCPYPRDRYEHDGVSPTTFFWVCVAMLMARSCSVRDPCYMRDTTTSTVR